MDLKNLANLNRVVIVDNSEKEGEAISRALDKQHVASHFIHLKGSGGIESVENFPNVRLVILDLELAPELNGDANKAAFALACLKRVVEENSHYALIIWSGHLDDPLATVFLEMLRDRGKEFYPCIEPICISKKNCKNKDGSFSATKINSYLKPELEKAADFELFAKWEVEINKVMSRFLRDLLGKEDQASLSGKLKALGIAYAGAKSDSDVGLYALLTLNAALKGTIDSAVASQNYKKNNARIEQGAPLSDDLKSALNGHLMLNPDKKLGPGSVFKVEHDYCKDLLSDTTGTVGVKIDITPLCDFAQEKYKFSYYVHALAVPETNTRKSNRQYINGYELHNKFHFEDHSWRLIVNLSTLETVKTGKKTLKQKDIWFKLRDDLVIGLQHRVSAHSSRPGHALLD